MARPNVRMNSLNDTFHDGGKGKTGPVIMIESAEPNKLRSNSLGDGRISPGFGRERHAANKLLKGAIMHNLLHPLDYYHERKVRSRSNSCSDDLDLEDGRKTPEIKKSRSRPASPTLHSRAEPWPVYKKVGSLRPRRVLSEQMSCPPAPQSTPVISVSPLATTPPVIPVSPMASDAALSTPSASCAAANDFFSHSIKNPVERHRDGHMLEHPHTRKKRPGSNSSTSSSDFFSDYSSYSSYSSSEYDSEEDAPQISVGAKRSTTLAKSSSDGRRSSDPLKGATEEKSSSPLSKSPLHERHSSGPQKIPDRETCRSTLSVPIPKDAPSSPGTSPSSRFLSLIVNSVKKSSSHLALPRRKKKKKRKKPEKRMDSWDGPFGSGKNKRKPAEIFGKPPPNDQIRGVSSVEKLYSIYDQIILEGQLHRRHSMEPERRRNLSGGSQPGTYLRGEDPNQAAILFRDSRGLPMAAPFLDVVPRSELERDETQILVKFFKHHRTYDLIPTSAKLVVFDTRLQVKKAFYALVHNGVRAAPLWDSRRQQFVGMLTITDFIRILQNFYHTNRKMEELEDHTLELWRSLLHDDARELVSIGPDESLFDAIKMLITHQIHRLPVIDTQTGNVLYIITHKRVLKFLYLYMNELPKPSILQKTLKEVNIGTYENIQTATEDTRLIEALDVFVRHRVSALPIIDTEGRLIDIYAKFDAINLAAKGTYNNLNVTLKEANEYRNEWFEGVLKCTYNETLEAIMDRIVKAEVHRLVVVDKSDTVVGVLSLSDLLKELVLRPAANTEALHSVSVEDVITATETDLSPHPPSDATESQPVEVTIIEPADVPVELPAEIAVEPPDEGLKIDHSSSGEIPGA